MLHSLYMDLFCNLSLIFKTCIIIYMKKPEIDLPKIYTGGKNDN